MVKRVGRYAVLFLVLSLLSTAVASAQANPTGRLTGTVTDQQGRIIPRATVSVKNNQTGFESRTVANEVGVWETSSIPAGSYILSIAAPPSFSPYIDEVKVETGVTKTVDVTLHIGLENEVTVTASKYEEEVINAPATVSVVPEQAIQATASYNIAELLRAVPGVNVIQTSAITFNVSSRSAASAATNHQLALVDGRTIYWDFLGYSDWNMVTEDLDEVKQMEVVR
jgi:outer membrane receptor for ferrienterochelin and colicins